MPKKIQLSDMNTESKMTSDEKVNFALFMLVFLVMATVFCGAMYKRSTPEYQEQKLKEGEALKKRIETYRKANNL